MNRNLKVFLSFFFIGCCWKIPLLLLPKLKPQSPAGHMHRNIRPMSYIQCFCRAMTKCSFEFKKHVKISWVKNMHMVFHSSNKQLVTLKETLCDMGLHFKNLKKKNIFSWEQEGHYEYSKMFCWEPEGRYRCTMSMENNALLVLNGTSLNSDTCSTLLALNLHFLLSFVPRKKNGKRKNGEGFLNVNKQLAF